MNIEELKRIEDSKAASQELTNEYDILKEEFDALDKEIDPLYKAKVETVVQTTIADFEMYFKNLQLNIGHEIDENYRKSIVAIYRRPIVKLTHIYLGLFDLHSFIDEKTPREYGVDLLLKQSIDLQEENPSTISKNIERIKRAIDQKRELVNDYDTEPWILRLRYSDGSQEDFDSIEQLLSKILDVDK